MAVIIRGKHKTKEVVIHQFCNDWVMIEHPDIPVQQSIVSPTNLRYSEEEKARMDLAETQGKTGTMFHVYFWDSPNTLKKKPLFRNSNF